MEGVIGLKRQPVRNPLLLIVIILAGAIVGNAVWGLISPKLPSVLAGSFLVGTRKGPLVLNLSFVELTFGIVLNMNIGSILGIILSVLIYRKL